MKTKTLFALCALMFSVTTGKAEFVPNEATAVRIAIAAWKPAYGADKIATQKPFSAVLIGRVWQVQPSSRNRFPGGRLYAEVVRLDGSIRTIRLNR
jgi:hypothetical protein